MSTERVPFRFIIMECCGHQLCWVNPRLPSFCPECGERIYPQVKSWITLEDGNATLRINVKPNLALKNTT